MTVTTEAITIRGLEAGTKQKLRRRAVEHGHSMEAEARSILRVALAPNETEEEQEEEVDLATAIRRRFAKFGGLELELPPRDLGRDPPDFSGSDFDPK